MTDPADPSGGQPRPGPVPRLGDSRGPVTTVSVLVIAAVAVIAGLLILQSVDEPAISDDTAGGAAATTTATTSPPSTEPATTSTTSTTSTTTTTTTRPPSKGDAAVLVANASGIGGSATEMGEELEADGYVVSEIGNATGERRERTVIYYVDGNPAARGVASLLADAIPMAQVAPMPDPPPLDRSLGIATVAVLVGRDAAGQSLAELQAG